MTFLEFVCRKLLGPPVSGSCWRCPYCDSNGASFSVRPPKGDLPIKFKCHRCGEWGDEFDLMKLFHPVWGFSLRHLQLADLRRQYESHQGNDSSVRGSGKTKSMDRQQPPAHRDDP